jgi:dTMP kinase
MFFVFEGLDGSGKSTQLDRLVGSLRAQGYRVTSCRDPGSTELGNRVRQILLDPASPAIGPGSEMLLFMVARCQLVHEVIRPSLSRGEIVVCDRFEMSTLVYQGHAGEVPLDDIRGVGRAATGGLEPELTFVLDLPVEAALGRIRRGLDRMEARGPDYLERVRQGFLSEARRNPSHCLVIDAADSVDQVAAAIERRVATFLAESRISARTRS